MKLIDNVGIVWHRLWSMRFILATTAYSTAAGAWETVIPRDWKPELTHVEQMLIAGIGIILPVSAALSIVVKQQKLADTVTEKTGTATITVPVNENSEHA